MSLLLALHVTFAGIWLGCLLTEAVFEQSFLGFNRQDGRLIARLHRQVDLIIELPAFTGVAITGACLALDEYTQFAWLMWLKVSLGILAIVLNVYCVWQVLRREHFSQHAHWSSFDLANQRQRMAGIMVITLVLLTLLLAIV